MTTEGKFIRRNCCFFQRVFSASQSVVAKHVNSLRHVATVGRIHFDKELADNYALSNFQPAYKYTTHHILATVEPHQPILTAIFKPVPPMSSSSICSGRVPLWINGTSFVCDRCPSCQPTIRVKVLTELKPLTTTAVNHQLTSFFLYHHSTLEETNGNAPFMPALMLVPVSNHTTSHHYALKPVTACHCQLEHTPV